MVRRDGRLAMPLTNEAKHGLSLNRDGAGDVVGAGGGVALCVVCPPCSNRSRGVAHPTGAKQRVTRTNRPDAVRKTQFVRT